MEWVCKSFGSSPTSLTKKNIMMKLLIVLIAIFLIGYAWEKIKIYYAK